MILTRFTGASAALGAWCVPATAGAAATFELSGVRALFQTIGGLAPSHTLQTATNLRTAGHVGVQPGEQRQRGFDFAFPQP